MYLDQLGNFVGYTKKILIQILYLFIICNFFSGKSLAIFFILWFTPQDGEMFSMNEITSRLFPSWHSLFCRNQMWKYWTTWYKRLIWYFDSQRGTFEEKYSLKSKINKVQTMTQKNDKDNLFLKGHCFI